MLKPQPTLEQHLTCSICLDVYTSPVTVECLHTFCRACLKDHANATVTFSRFKCPNCQKTLNMPHGGIEGLPTDHRIASIVDYFRNEAPVDSIVGNDVRKVIIYEVKSIMRNGFPLALIVFIAVLLCFLIPLILVWWNQGRLHSTIEQIRDQNPYRLDLIKKCLKAHMEFMKHQINAKRILNLDENNELFNVKIAFLNEINILKQQLYEKSTSVVNNVNDDWTHQTLLAWLDILIKREAGNNGMKGPEQWGLEVYMMATMFFYFLVASYGLIKGLMSEYKDQKQREQIIVFSGIGYVLFTFFIYNAPVFTVYLSNVTCACFHFALLIDDQRRKHKCQKDSEDFFDICICAFIILLVFIWHYPLFIFGFVLFLMTCWAFELNKLLDK